MESKVLESTDKFLRILGRTFPKLKEKRLSGANIRSANTQKQT
jgi:hypothetical protein